MRLLLVATLLICAALLAACTSAANDPATPTIDFASEARRLVGDAVFNAEDLTGFEPSGADDLQAQAGLSAECDIFEAGVVFPAAVATADSGAYVGPLGEQLLNYAGIYRTTDDVSAAVAGTQDILDRCEAEFNAAVEAVARDYLDDLGIDLGVFTTIEVTIGAYDPPPSGDEVVGYRMNVNVNLVLTNQQYNLDVIVVRKGRVAGAFVYGKLGAINENTEAELQDLMTGKLSAVNGSLPE